MIVDQNFALLILFNGEILLIKWIKQPKSYETFIKRKSKIVNKMITEINGHIDLALD